MIDKNAIDNRFLCELFKAHVLEGFQPAKPC